MEFLYCKKKFMQRCIAKNLTDNNMINDLGMRNLTKALDS